MGPANSFQLCPITIRADKNKASPLLPNLLPNFWDKRGLKQTKNAKALENVQQIGTLSDPQGRLATVATEFGDRCAIAREVRFSDTWRCSHELPQARSAKSAPGASVRWG